jgi:hypothetical protein
MDAQTQVGGARRQHQRPAKSSVLVICQRGELFLGPNLAESLVDASEEALGILTREALWPGERVSITLEGVGRPAAIQRVGRTVWCDPAEGGRFRCEVELDDALGYAEFLSLVTL